MVKCQWVMGIATDRLACADDPICRWDDTVVSLYNINLQNVLREHNLVKTGIGVSPDPCRFLLTLSRRRPLIGGDPQIAAAVADDDHAVAAGGVYGVQ